MIPRLSLIALFWLGSLLAYGISYEEVYPQVLDFLFVHQSQIKAYGILGPVGLVALSFILSQAKLFSQILLLARLFFEVSQLVIYLLSFAAVVFWFDFQRNVWLDLGPIMAAMPFIALVASCASLWIFDFNYPQRNRIGRNFFLPALSLIIIYVSKLIG